MQITVIETIASQRAKEVERRRPGVSARVEVQPNRDRAVISYIGQGVQCGVEFVESRGSVSHPDVDREYLRFIRDDLYLGILVPSSLPYQLEDDLVVRLRALREHARDEGYPSTKGTVIYEYDAEGNIERLGVGTSE